MNELEKENACGHAVRATDPIARKPHRSPTELDGQLVIVMAHASAVEPLERQVAGAEPAERGAAPQEILKCV